MPKETSHGSTNIFLPLTKAPKTNLKRISSLYLSTKLSSGRFAKKNITSPVCDSEVAFHPVQRSVGVFVYENGDSDKKPVGPDKDRLVQEIEKRLAEIEDNYSNTSKLEEEKSAVEMERSSLLRDIEETVAGIQRHVLNSSELEDEKIALEEECKGLREQVENLKKILDGHSGKADESDGKEISSLKDKISKLSLENEYLRSKLNVDSGDIPSELMSRELKLLHDENANLQKLLHMAEESEDNMANELVSSHSKLTEIQKFNDDLKRENKELKSSKEQLELDREELEEELESLHQSIRQEGDKNGNILMLKESKEELAKAVRKSVLLENDNNAMKKRIDQLEDEILQLKSQLEKSDSTSNPPPKETQTVVQLKSALEKLNKETSTLHESLEKAENEITSLKSELEKEKYEKEKLKSDATEKGKKQKGKKENDGGKNKGDGEFDELEASRRDIFNLKSECQALSETVAKTANEKRQMAKEIEKLNEEKGKLESKVGEMEETVDSLRKVRTEKEDLEGKYVSLTSVHEDVSKQLELVNQSCSEKDSVLQQRLAEKESVEQLCREYETSIKRITADLASSKQDGLSKADEIKLMKRKFEEERKGSLVTVQENKQELQKLQDELQLLSIRLKASEEEKNGVLQSQSSTGTELNNLRIVVDEMRKELKITQQNLSKSEELRFAAEEKVLMAERVAEDLEKSNAVFNDMAMEKSLELSRTRRILEKKVEKLTKENIELRRKCGIEALPLPKSQLPQLAPVAVQMHKISSLDVNLDYLSKQLSRGQDDDRIQIQDAEPAEKEVGRLSPKVIRNEVLISPAGVRLKRTNEDNALLNYNYENHYSDRVYVSDSLQHSNSDPASIPPAEYRIVASEVHTAVSSSQHHTSSAIHVGSASQTEHSSTSSSLSDLHVGQEKNSHLQWTGDDWAADESRLNAHMKSNTDRASYPANDSSVKQNSTSSESVFQVVGYRKGGKIIHEHWV